jgi:hypothetical protein
MLGQRRVPIGIEVSNPQSQAPANRTVLVPPHQVPFALTTHVLASKFGGKAPLRAAAGLS